MSSTPPTSPIRLPRGAPCPHAPLRETQIRPIGNNMFPPLGPGGIVNIFANGNNVDNYFAAQFAALPVVPPDVANQIANLNLGNP